MGRITKIQGTFMGVPFEVKPTPLSFDDVQERTRQMMMDWYKQRHPELAEKLDSETFELENASDDEVMALLSWKRDVDFRALYLEAKASACMDFKKPLPQDVWRRDDLELSTIEEAWDFFAGRRIVPLSGV